MADAEVLGLELGYAGFGVFAVLLGVGHEVFALGRVAAEMELEEVLGFDDSAEAYFFGAVFLVDAALFYLLEVAEAIYGLTFADGEGAVAEIDEHFAAL